MLFYSEYFSAFLKFFQNFQKFENFFFRFSSNFFYIFVQLLLLHHAEKNDKKF